MLPTLSTLPAAKVIWTVGIVRALNAYATNLLRVGTHIITGFWVRSYWQIV
jgi:hypothetical protein